MYNDQVLLVPVDDVIPKEWIQDFSKEGGWYLRVAESICGIPPNGMQIENWFSNFKLLYLRNTTKMGVG